MAQAFHEWTLKQIKAYMNQQDLTQEEIEALAEDSRQGVHRLLQAYEKKIKRLQALKEDSHKKLTFERQYWAQGYQSIAGVDEVGRGPLAGPVIAAAVILKPEPKLLGVKDSKQLSSKQRKELEYQIKDQALAYGYGQVDAEDIDQINILQATKLAMAKAIEDLQQHAVIDFILLDALEVDIDLPQRSLVKGDSLSLTISCASILAKEKRDRLMKDYAKTYPHYGFDRHMGYGTSDHLQALENYGPCPIHRRSFKPVRLAAKQNKK